MATEPEHFYRVSRTVDSIQEAFEFVMLHLDVIGDDPQISISPIWIYGGARIATSDDVPGDDVEVNVRCFECSISGTPKVPAVPQRL